MRIRKAQGAKAGKAPAGKIFVISGPSGSGKTTLTTSLLENKKLKDKLSRSISFTTRPRRPIEKEGRDYFFIKKEAFQRKLRQKKILEWTKYLGYYYGTPKDIVDQRLKEGKSIVFCLDLNGAKKLKKLYAQAAVTIFVLPPSLKELHSRITGRCNTAGKEIKRRLKLADKEVAAAYEYDYRLLNRNFQNTTEKLSKIILKEIN